VSGLVLRGAIVGPSQLAVRISRSVVSIRGCSFGFSSLDSRKAPSQLKVPRLELVSQIQQDTALPDVLPIEHDSVLGVALVSVRVNGKLAVLILLTEQSFSPLILRNKVSEF
jgi:hypothetical protein